MVEFKNDLEKSGDSPHLRENRYGSLDISSQAKTIRDILVPKDIEVVTKAQGMKNYKQHKRLRNRMNMSALDF